MYVHVLYITRWLWNIPPRNKEKAGLGGIFYGWADPVTRSTMKNPQMGHRGDGHPWMKARVDSTNTKYG